MRVHRVRRELDERRRRRRPPSRPRFPAAPPRWRSHPTTGFESDTDEPPAGGSSPTSATRSPPSTRIPSATNKSPWSCPAVPPIRTIEVDLSILEVELPRTQTGMVLAQPHLDLTQHEPYRSTNSSKQCQLQAIQEALEVARTACNEDSKTHFTIFPEYSIPAPEGVELIEDTLRQKDWPTQTIVIGGMDGLAAGAYAQLVAAPGTHVDKEYNDPARVPTDQWINCAIIWAKGADGTVERWLQPKLCTSRPEEEVADSNMFTGNSVFVFCGQFDDGRPYRFAVLVCFDWIGDANGRRPWRAVVEELSEHATSRGADIPLHWMIVIEHNQKPSDKNFMMEVNEFFNNTFAANVRRERACVIFANSAGQPTAGRVQQNGNTSVIFSQQTLFWMPKCHGTFCSGGLRFRGHDLINHHKDCLFREGGACVHSFRLVNPDSVKAGPAGRTVAVKEPSVHPLVGGQDPRTPGDVVPGSVKWLNDELDAVPSLTSLTPDYRSAALAGAVDVAHERTMDGLREASRSSAAAIVRLASPTVTGQGGEEKPEEPRHADRWGSAEKEAVVHVIHTISILDVCSDLCTVAGASAHATLSIRGRELDVIAVRGETHEACREHYLRELPGGRRPVLLVSRDVDNNERLQRLGSYVEAGAVRDWAERSYTDPEEIACQLGYKDLLTVYLASDNTEDAKGRLHDKLPR